MDSRFLVRPKTGRRKNGAAETANRAESRHRAVTLLYGIQHDAMLAPQARPEKKTHRAVAANRRAAALQASVVEIFVQLSEQPRAKRFDISANKIARFFETAIAGF